MMFRSIDEIFSANEAAHQELKTVLASISDDAAIRRVDNERWNVAEIVEHVAIVDEGAAKICSKLLSKTPGRTGESTGRVHLSESFVNYFSTAGATKLEAPERVLPSGSVSIAESLARIDNDRIRLTELKGLFESDGSGATFPHPYFGDLSAVEWLVLIGGHEKRHTDQIRRLLEKLN